MLQSLAINHVPTVSESPRPQDGTLEQDVRDVLHLVSHFHSYIYSHGLKELYEIFNGSSQANFANELFN